MRWWCAMRGGPFIRAQAAYDRYTLPTDRWISARARARARSPIRSSALSKELCVRLAELHAHNGGYSRDSPIAAFCSALDPSFFWRASLVYLAGGMNFGGEDRGGGGQARGLGVVYTPE